MEHNTLEHSTLKENTVKCMHRTSSDSSYVRLSFPVRNQNTRTRRSGDTVTNCSPSGLTCEAVSQQEKGTELLHRAKKEWTITVTAIQ